jgi:hypothetical protein
VPIWKPRTRNIERQTRAYEKNQKVRTCCIHCMFCGP